MSPLTPHREAEFQLHQGEYIAVQSPIHTTNLDAIVLFDKIGDDLSHHGIQWQLIHINDTTRAIIVATEDQERAEGIIEDARNGTSTHEPRLDPFRNVRVAIQEDTRRASGAILTKGDYYALPQ